MSKRKKYLAPALLFGVAAAGSIAFAFAKIGQSAAFPFRSVTPAELASGGVKVSAASLSGNLRTTAAQAAEAVRRYQGRRALEVRYARCVDTLEAPKLDQDCWAVSADPHGMTVPSQGPLKVRWDLVFVDAGTGKVIEARLG